MFEGLRKMFVSFFSKLRNCKGTDVVEINDTTATDLDYAIPELNEQGSAHSNMGKQNYL